MESPPKGRKSGAVERFTRSILTVRQPFTHWSGLVSRISSGCCEGLAGELFCPVCAPVKATAAARITDCRRFNISVAVREASESYRFDTFSAIRVPRFGVQSPGKSGYRTSSVPVLQVSGNRVNQDLG